MVYKHTKKNKADTIISQVYDGSWSFGRGVWSLDGKKFYFDNSGAVACIWELNLKNRTLNKIVPEHKSKCPIFYREGTEDRIMYCQDNCLMIARPR